MKDSQVAAVCAVCDVIKYSENSVKPEVDFEPNQGEIVFCKFLPRL